MTDYLVSLHKNQLLGISVCLSIQALQRGKNDSTGVKHVVSTLIPAISKNILKIWKYME